MYSNYLKVSGDYNSRNLGLTGGGERVSEAQPALGVVVEQLVASVAHYQSQRRELEMLNRKSHSELSPVDLQEVRSIIPSFLTSSQKNQTLKPFFSLSLYFQFLPEGMSALEQRALSVQQLKTQVQRKERELALTSYIIDNCLYLVWLHLDFYLYRGLPHPRSGVNLDSSVVHGELNLIFL